MCANYSFAQGSCFLPRVAFCVSAVKLAPSQPFCCRTIMRKRGPTSRKGPTGPAGFSREREERLAEIAKKYGVQPPKEGAALDRKYNTPASSTTTTEGPTFYQRLAGIFGVGALDAAERVVYVVLGVLLIGVITGGIVISSEAFLKASGREVPDILDTTAVTVEQAFTPVVIFFIALSSLLGVFKQSQLNSGATSYDTLSNDERES